VKSKRQNLNIVRIAPADSASGFGDALLINLALDYLDG